MEAEQGSARARNSLRKPTIHNSLRKPTANRSSHYHTLIASSFTFEWPNVDYEGLKNDSIFGQIMVQRGHTVRFQCIAIVEHFNSGAGSAECNCGAGSATVEVIDAEADQGNSPLPLSLDKSKSTYHIK